MNYSHSSPKTNQIIIIERLTALWALSESGLGGILHALQIPLKGILVNGLSVILITLIGYYALHKYRDIIKATLIVIVIKAMVSPHTPPTAYIAVAFQGLMGGFIYGYINNIRLGAIFLAIITFLESALQRLLMLTIIFGNPLWESINVFFDFILREFHLLQENETSDASFWIIAFYLLIYLLAGVVFGLFSGMFPRRLDRIKAEEIDIPDSYHNLPVEQYEKSKPWWKRKKYQILTILTLITLVLYLLSAKYDMSIGIYVFFRTLLVIGIWYSIIAPLVMKFMNKFLKRQRSKYAMEIDKVLFYLPELKNLARTTWEHTNKFTGFRRITFFLEFLIARVLFQAAREE